MTGKPREATGEPRDAGFGDGPAPEAPDALPFEPGEVPVDDLRERLEEIDDVEALHSLQRADTRTTAAAHYERRIAALTEE